jgi:hypothetical protein
MSAPHPFPVLTSSQEMTAARASATVDNEQGDQTVEDEEEVPGLKGTRLSH